MEELHKLIRNMDLPQYRKEGTSHKNLQWLYKNLKVRNESHKNYNTTMELLKQMLKIKK